MIITEEIFVVGYVDTMILDYGVYRCLSSRTCGEEQQHAVEPTKCSPSWPGVRDVRLGYRNKNKHISRALAGKGPIKEGILDRRQEKGGLEVKCPH